MYDLKQFLKLSEEEQHQKMNEWLTEIATASEEQRQEALRELLLATSQLDVPDKEKVLKVRTMVLIKLPLEQIKTIVISRRRAMQDLREIDEADREVVFSLVREMPDDVQQAIARIVMELRDEFAPN